MYSLADKYNNRDVKCSKLYVIEELFKWTNLEPHRVGVFNDCSRNTQG